MPPGNDSGTVYLCAKSGGKPRGDIVDDGVNGKALHQPLKTRYRVPLRCCSRIMIKMYGYMRTHSIMVRNINVMVSRLSFISSIEENS